MTPEAPSEVVLLRDFILLFPSNFVETNFTLGLEDCSSSGHSHSIPSEYSKRCSRELSTKKAFLHYPFLSSCIVTTQISKFMHSIKSFDCLLNFHCKKLSVFEQNFTVFVGFTGCTFIFSGTKILSYIKACIYLVSIDHHC